MILKYDVSSKFWTTRNGKRVRLSKVFSIVKDKFSVRVEDADETFYLGYTDSQYNSIDNCYAKDSKEYAWYNAGVEFHHAQQNKMTLDLTSMFVIFCCVILCIWLF